MEKYLRHIPAFILGILFILFYKFGVTGLLSSELSYNMNGVEPRFVDTFRYTPVHRVKQIANMENDIVGAQYFNKLQVIAPQIESVLHGKRINENIFVYISDIGNYPISAKIINGKVTFKSGINSEAIPTAVFTVTKREIDGLASFFSDGKLDNQESFKIADVLMGPMLERMYRLSRFYKVQHLSSFKFDNFIQFEILGGEDLDRDGTPTELRYTLVNVDGQWIIQKGFIGDPDIRYSLTLDQSLALYELMVIKLENSANKIDAINISKDAFDILKNGITYIRDDHR